VLIQANKWAHPFFLGSCGPKFSVIIYLSICFCVFYCLYDLCTCKERERETVFSLSHFWALLDPDNTTIRVFLNRMCYISSRFTYLLTYLFTCICLPILRCFQCPVARGYTLFNILFYLIFYGIFSFGRHILPYTRCCLKLSCQNTCLHYR